jgi:phospholipid/cholesterol/gamma-HCH transport system substrate-binding protein
LQIKAETVVGIFILVALGVFFYMSFFLGVFRFDRLKYHQYVVYFQDVSGLEKKADVRIAGVKVGWIDNIELATDGQAQARASMMVAKQYMLHSDAHAIIRQDGLLGTKYIDLIPGDADLSRLLPGQALGAPGKSPVIVDDILHKVRDIATDVQEVTHSLRQSFGGPSGQEELSSMFRNFQQAAEKIASVSNVLDRTLSSNEGNLNGLLSDLREFARDLRENFPAMRGGIERASMAIDRDVSRVANSLESTAHAIEDAALHARDGFKNLGSVAEKLDEGKGLLGKLINEDETYRDLKVTIQGLKNYFSKMESVQVVLDAHGEFMYRPAEHVQFEDAKGYFDARFHTSEDKFYVFQVVGSQKGRLVRMIRTKQWYDENGRPLLPSELLIDRVAIPELIGLIETTDRYLDVYKFGFQFGKIYKDIAFRMGLFENTVGFGLDIDIPFGCPDKFRWVTTFEAFDFRGRDRLNDVRPHLKWLNRVFILRNIYFAFGADDFISRQNANGFFGGGIRFCDDDVKYLMSAVGLGSVSGGGG